MNILVIGNGFDLAHGLPTKYSDFMNFIDFVRRMDSEIDKEESKGKKVSYIKKHKNNKYNEIKEDILDILENIFNSNKDEEVFNEFRKCIEDNKLLQYFKEKIIDSKNIEWAGFEVEIKELLKKFDYIKNNQKENLKEYFKDLENTELYVFFDTPLSQYDENVKNRHAIKKGMITKLEDDLKKLIRAFEIYIVLFINNINCEKFKGNISNIDLVISFNYTNTFERLYDDKKNDSEKIENKDIIYDDSKTRFNNVKVKYDYIHGKAKIDSDTEKNNMVLGVDEYLDEEIKNKDLDFIFFKKYFQRIYKETGCVYKSYIEDSGIYNKENNIYFYGHSLSRLDNDILKDLILRENSKSKIYYYSKESYGNQITNLVDIIGQDKLIDMIHSKNILFEKIKGGEKVEIEAQKCESRDLMVLQSSS